MLHYQYGYNLLPRPWPKPELSPSQPQALWTAQASILRSPSCSKPSQSQGLQAELGLHNTIREARYMPDIIGEPFIDFAHLKELTALTEGEVYSLKKFAAEWSGQVASKCTRRVRKY